MYVRTAAVRPLTVETPPSMVLVDAMSKLRRERYKQPRKLVKSAIEKRSRSCRRTSFEVPTMPMSGSSKGAMQCGRKVGGQYTESSHSTVRGHDTLDEQFSKDLQEGRNLQERDSAWVHKFMGSLGSRGLPITPSFTSVPLKSSKRIFIALPRRRRSIWVIKHQSTRAFILPHSKKQVLEQLESLIAGKAMRTA